MDANFASKARADPPAEGRYQRVTTQTLGDGNS